MATSLNPPYAALTDSDLIVRCIDQRIFDVAPPSESNCRKNSRRIAKALAIIGGPIARLPFVRIPMKHAGENTFYQIILVYGNTTSYGAVISWCFLKIVDSQMTSRTSDEVALTEINKSPCFKTTLKIGLTAMGVLAQVPLAYLAYYYNDKDILYPIAVLVMDSAFPIYSLLLSAEEISRRQRLAPYEKKLVEFKNKTKATLQKIQYDLIKNKNQVKSCFEELNSLQSQSNLTSQEKVRHYLATILNKHQPEDAIPYTRSCPVLLGRGLSGACGVVLGVSQCYFMYTLGSFATKEMWDNEFATYTVAGFITACTAYLNFDVVMKSTLKTYDMVIDYFQDKDLRSSASYLQPKLWSGLQLLGLITTGLSYSGPMQACADFYEGDMRIAMQVTSVISTMMLTTYALNELINDLVVGHSLKWGGKEIKQLAKMHSELQYVIDIVDKSPLIEFAYFLKVLPEDVMTKWRDELGISADDLGQCLQQIKERQPLLEQSMSSRLEEL